eukprot:SM000038S14281  [mRNA]  locus=s38:50774:57040:+ [translate_table: standard]
MQAGGAVQVDVMPRAAVPAYLTPPAPQQLPRSHPPPACSSSPIREFFFFHKAIRGELARLHQDALALERGDAQDVDGMTERYRFLCSVYKYHSSAEDVVILPALDERVKNVAHTYSLEHKVESDRFNQMTALLLEVKEKVGQECPNLLRQLVCATEALQTTLRQHLFKEEQQVFPLLMENFSAAEQADLVWQFMCSIPVSLIEECLPWIKSFLSEVEQQEMMDHMYEVVPGEELLQQVVSMWLSDKDAVSSSRNSHWSDGKGTNTALPLRAPREDLSPEAEAVSGERCQGSITELSTEASGASGRAVGYWPFLSSTDAKETAIRHPIDELILWHNAIRMDLDAFADKVANLRGAGQLSRAVLDTFAEQYRFLNDVCLFHGTAEDKVVLPTLRMSIQSDHEQLPESCYAEHAEEEQRFHDVAELLEKAQLRIDNDDSIARDLVEELCQRSEGIVATVRLHLLTEEEKVLPLARKYCSVEEQRVMVYQSLRVMPLRLLQRVLPWLTARVSEEEAVNMIQNMHLAAPLVDAPLVNLFSGWATRSPLSSPGSPDDVLISQGRASIVDTCRNKDNSSNSSPSTASTGCPSGTERSGQISEGLLERVVTGTTMEASTSGRSEAAQFVTRPEHVAIMPKPVVQTSCCCPTGLFGWGRVDRTSGRRSPIDNIFQFHKAIRKDLQYLSSESAKLGEGGDELLLDFSGRFQFLWGLYRAHSNAEDDIVFPALEAKEALHNVSHSYTIDHKQEEQLFEDIASVISQMRSLSSSEKGPEEKEKQRRSLAGQLHRMCQSVYVSLDQHVSREEVELWPLFTVHFTSEEQDKIVGRIIGTTGAEVLQSILPWITGALTKEEQEHMMDSWRNATRNTMFEQWLSAWWKDSKLGGSTVAPAVVSNQAEESLKMVLDYFGASETQRKQNGVSIVASSDSLLQGNTADLERSADAFEVASCTEGQHCCRGQGNCLRKRKRERSDDGMPGLLEADVKACAQQVEEERETFKPGWQDIFRMNQKELEAAMYKVSRDPSLDPRKKDYLMQNLMTSRWIVAQQKQKPGIDGADDCSAGLKPSYYQEAGTDGQAVFGCPHYKRNCKLRAACCGQLFTCRFCHDDVSDHTMNRHATQEMMCMRCLQVQPVSQTCATPSCQGFVMARYYCSICKFFDDDERDIYHCPSCNLCRVGKGLGIDYFHCMTCNACMSKSLSSHKCLEKGMESDCPICHDFLFTSKTPVKALPCGHFMHSACFQGYTSNYYTCPICSRSLGDMGVYFGMLDALLAAEELPAEYKDREQDILCNDCGKEGVTRFHWVHHKCPHCGSYNSRTI